MLKDRAIQVRLVREPAMSRVGTPSAQKPQESVWTPETINAMIQDQVNNLLMTAGMVYALKVAVDTLSGVIIKKTKSKDSR